VFVCGDLAEAPEAWQSLVGQTYSVSPLTSPVEPPEDFNPNEFMVNIGLALKELLPEKAEATSSLVNFNALPEAYLPERFSIVRVLVPVGIVIGIGLVVFMGILVLQNRANIETLRSELRIAESSVVQQQRDITQLRAGVGSIKAKADVLHNRLIAIERGRAVLLEDLRQIHRLAIDKVTLRTVNHTGSSVTVRGAAAEVDDIFSYARDLRSGGRFSSVWISSITDGGKEFTFSLTK